MKQVQYNISEMERAFECGRNFQLTGENNFPELIEKLTPVTPVNEGQQQPAPIDDKKAIVDGIYKAYGSDSGVLFGIKERSIVEAIVEFTINKINSKRDY
jgi:hypothetical protein